MYRTVFRTLWEKVRVGWFERIALKHVYYHIRKKKKKTPDNHNLGPQHQVRWSNCAMLDNPRLVCISVCDGPDNPARKQ